MSLRRMFDRKLMLMVLSPIARAILSLVLGYLAAKGVPPNLLDQLAASCGVAAAVVFNVSWELVDRARAETKAARKVVDLYNRVDGPAPSHRDVEYALRRGDANAG